ncbi:hypothetical protein ACEPPN_011012 [Leptodophora sp. 'Broadleaf-Isolate-01']
MERSSERIVPVISTEGAAYNQTSNFNNQSSSVLQPGAQATDYTDGPFSTDEELRQVQLDYMKLFAERPEMMPGSKEWYEKMKREGRLDGEDARDGSLWSSV